MRNSGIVFVTSVIYFVIGSILFIPVCIMFEGFFTIPTQIDKLFASIVVFVYFCSFFLIIIKNKKILIAISIVIGVLTLLLYYYETNKPNLLL